MRTARQPRGGCEATLTLPAAQLMIDGAQNIPTKLEGTAESAHGLSPKELGDGYVDFKRWQPCSPDSRFAAIVAAIAFDSTLVAFCLMINFFPNA